VDPGQIAFGDKADDLRRKMRLLMDLIPTLQKPVTIKSLSDRVGLSEDIVHDYLKRWADKDLIELK